MEAYLKELLEQQKKNFIFLGEAGSGKTEIAINFAMELAKNGVTNIHFFDLDQTKPLFRSRDVLSELEQTGITFHYEKQCADAPTIGGGTAELLNDPQAICVLDIGGNQQGSRMIGGYAHLTRRADAANYFVINPYRPWSRQTEAIDRTMTDVLRMARIPLTNTAVICNPNQRLGTTEADVLQGIAKTEEMLGEFLDISCVCVMRELREAVEQKTELPVFPLDLYMKYAWEE